ncbi:UNVERIFIED_CONTAM: hypothetical protein GTU68_064389 [Idotea baltica]|nr:hypothetical protein [Idotea baltica]
MVSLTNFIVLVFLYSVHLSSALKLEDCEVCITYLDKFIQKLSEKERSDPKLIESKIKEECKNSKGKENRFCYYIGGMEDSATGILGELSKPISWGMPSDKVCEKLKKKDGQICQLRYDKPIDLKNVELKKLKVRDLKKILNDWDESCLDCIEKGDFIKRIEELKPLYVKEEL